MSLYRVAGDARSGQHQIDPSVRLDAHRLERTTHRIAMQSALPFPLLFLFGVCLVLFVNQAWSADIGPIPIQVLLVWIITAWLFLFRGRALFDSLSIFSSWQKVAVVTLCGFAFLRGMLDGGNILRITQILTGIALALQSTIFFRDDRGRKMLFIALTFGAVTSSLVAVLQWLDLAPELWQRSVYSYYGYFTYGATGLEGSPVSYAYSVVGIGIVLIAGWMLVEKRLPRWLPFPPVIALLLSVIVLAGLVASNSRSGLLGLGIGTAVVVVGARFLRFKSIPLPIWIAIGGIALGYILAIRASSVFEDVRVFAAWVVYVPTLFAFPLGRPDFLALDDLLYQTYSDSAPDPEIVQSFMMGRTISPHNLFLTTGMVYGPIAALAFVFLYASLLIGGVRCFRRLHEKGDVVLAVWVLVLIAANVAVLVHSWFHNASLAVGEMRNWLWVGLLLSQVRVAFEKALALKPDYAAAQKALRDLKP